ncbi:hypothetical protein [Luteimonas sp. MHLX1A]|uniref:hypothetical protein n=1 Tax=Alterluteimonas muca TaxID=2878684 RepID=UPI001E38F116|nr:hypothetical protein [Luteimonas sp. MHLX1A]MCD9046756.1 hypothetical protein [Luteimonas sp. MHLX1A]
MTTPLALPRFGADSQAGTRRVVADGMNGVTPALRDFALRKVRRSLRRGGLSATRAMRAMALGDSGIASLFPVSQLPPPPVLAAHACGTGLHGAPDLLKDSLWFVEHAIRRGVADLGVLERLLDPTSAQHEIAALLLETWNRLLLDYVPSWMDWTPGAGSVRPVLRALPGPFATSLQSAQVVIEADSVSRMFVNVDTLQAPDVLRALSTLDKAMQFNLFAADPLGTRELYFEYSIGFELQDDVRQHIHWPDGADEPVVTDHEAITRIAEDFGYEAEGADYIAERAIAQMVFDRRMQQAMESVPASTTPESELARRILGYAEHLSSMNAPRPDLDSNALSLPACLVATYDFDPAGDEIANAIDNECQEEVPSTAVSNLSTRPSTLDRQLARLVAEMVVTEAVYALVHEGEEAHGD